MVRHKNRYMIVEINPEHQSKDGTLIVKRAALQNVLMRTIHHLHGDFGVAAVRAGFTVKYCNEKTRIAIIKARHGPHKLVASCLPCIKSLEFRRIGFTTLYTGATIRQCYKFILDYQQKKVEQLCVTAKSDEEKMRIAEELLNMQSVVEMT